MDDEKQIIVGFDFGTHQTKICVEITERGETKYHFFSFEDRDGKKQFAIPSVVQLNEDETLSYGFVDESKAKYDFIRKEYPKEEPKYPEEPELEIKNPPKHPLFKLYPPKHDPVNYDDLRKSKVKLDHILDVFGKYDNELEKWKDDICKVYDDYHNRVTNWIQNTNDAVEKYRKDIDEWEEVTDRMRQEYEDTDFSFGEPCIYRYFKLAYLYTNRWNYDIEPDVLCLWYICYVLFLIEKEYGADFFIQMGVPTGEEEVKQQQCKAVRLMLSAVKMVDEEFNGNLKEFLSCTIAELRSRTKWVTYTEAGEFMKSDERFILVFPEAWACLKPLLKRGKIESGMNLMVDIGGGTTDLAFFTIQEKKPCIYKFESAEMGLNHLVDLDDSIENMSFTEDILDEEKVKEYVKYIKKVWNGIRVKLNKLLQTKNVLVTDLSKALRDRPLIYTGGGATMKSLCSKINEFTDVKVIDETLWDNVKIDNMDEVEDLVPILSTAYGLSINEIDDDIKTYSLKTLFETLPERVKIVGIYEIED